jgi:hypothetical protein
MKKTVAIIGSTGNMGSAIALGLAAAGYRVLLTDDIKRNCLLYMKLPLREHKIRHKVPAADVDIVLSAREVSWEADIIILAIPYATHAELAGKIKDVVTGKVVIVVVNPLNETHNGPVAAPTNSAAKGLAKLLPHSKIVQAFSTTAAGQPGDPGVAGMSVDVLVAGHDEEAVSTVMQLVKDIGYHPLVAGTLDGPVEQPVRTPRSSGNGRMDSSLRKVSSE